MPKLPWMLVLRVAALVALTASAALLSDYLADVPTFCGADGGCGAVRHSVYARIATSEGRSLPLPLFGVLGFVGLFVASLLSRPLTLLAACIGGAAGLWLLSVQAFVIGHYCWMCVTTDVSAVLAAVAALAMWRSKTSADAALLLPSWTWCALGALALLAPLLWPSAKLSPAVPGPVLALYAPGKLNVVEFADFQCPACRMFHGILKPTLHKYGDRVHFVRLNKPLDMHADARDAARASVCGEAQGKREAIADALFAAEDLSPGGIDRVAVSIGLDAKVFEACMLDANTNARVDRESGLLSSEEFEGLPTTYIGGKRLIGVRSADELEDALERAARGEGVTGVAWYVYLPAVLLLALGLVRLGLRSRQARQPGTGNS